MYANNVSVATSPRRTRVHALDYRHPANEHRSVRGRRKSSNEVDLPAMTVADSPKKRKRTSSAKSGRKISIQIGRQKSVNMDPVNMEVDGPDIRELFDETLNFPKIADVYDNAHKKLLEKEDEDAWDREVKPKPTSRNPFDAIEKRAKTIIHVMREYERQEPSIFGNLPSEAIPGPETRDMGGQFLTNKDRIEEKSKLYEIAKLVPKGALLHLHFNAELNPEELLARANVQSEENDNMYIRSIMPLHTGEPWDDKDGAFARTEMVLSVLDPDKINPDVDIFSEEYPGTALNWKQPDMQATIWMKWSKFRKQFNAKFPLAPVQHKAPLSEKEPVRGCGEEPGRPDLDAAEYWLKSKMILSEDEAYGYTQTVNG